MRCHAGPPIAFSSLEVPLDRFARVGSSPFPAAPCVTRGAAAATPIEDENRRKARKRETLLDMNAPPDAPPEVRRDHLAVAGQTVLGSTICVTARSASVDDGSQGPRAPAHGMDACCVQHCTGLDGGVLGGFAELDAPPSPKASVLQPLHESGGHKRLAQLPVGARAPPVLVV